MSSEDQEHEQVPQPQMVFIPVSAPPQGQAGVSYPFLAPPQAYLPQNTHFVPLEQNNNSGGCRKWGGCRRWGNSEGGCCNSNRPQGTFSEFFWNLLFGLVAPVFAPFFVCLMETSQSARLGTLYGTADFFVVLGMSLLHRMNRGDDEEEGGHDRHENKHKMLGFGIATLVLGVILLVVACKKSWWMLYQNWQSLKEKKDAAAMDTVVSPAGTKCQYYVSFFISLVFPFIGTLIRVACNRSLHSRFGSFKGIAIFLFILGAVVLPFPLSVFGLVLSQVGAFHFRRAIILADIKAGNEESIFSCWTKRCGQGRCNNNNNNNENVTPA